jgi:oxygen-independent coproporphyrinogen-3 oxidase
LNFVEIRCMAGIYIHIPFCKQACHYCDFHFSTSMKYKDEMMEALLREIDLRKNYLNGEVINTIYFGGGTPSIVPAKDIDKLIKKIHQDFEISSLVEVTLEANPDDLNKEHLQQLHQIGINRLSIGVQSFFNKDLEWMNRAHHKVEALDCIRRAQDIGIENISIDLIYGTPGLTDQEWLQNIHTTLELEVPHISSYALTVESKTALGNWVEKGKVKPMDEEQAASQFEILMEELESNGFEHYEISNFARPGYYSKHNSSYWEGAKYIGIGPSAHSFDKNSRQWNIANNNKYIDEIFRDQLPMEVEQLKLNDRFNEYLMLSFRTSKGVSKKYIEDEFGSSILSQFEESVKAFKNNNWVILENNYYKTTKSGKLMADKIAAELFITENFE